MNGHRHDPLTDAELQAAAMRWTQLRDERGSEAQWLEWSAADPRRVDAFSRVSELASQLRALPEESRHELLGEFAPQAAPSRRWLGLAAIAASLLVVAVAIGFGLLRQSGESSQTFVTAIAVDREFALPDGSRIALGGASRLQTHFAADLRQVELSAGEAFFQVAHDRDRPFIVAAGAVSIRAVGTAFNVRLRSDVVELTVTEGVVSVRDNDHGDDKVQPAEIAAGGGAVVRSGTIAVTPLDRELVSQRVAWREGIIALDGNTIEQAVAEFNRYRDHPMVIGDPRIASLRIGGRFEVRESDRFLAALQRSFPIRALPGADQSVLLVYDE